MKNPHLYVGPSSCILNSSSLVSTACWSGLEGDNLSGDLVYLLFSSTLA